jgi:hypothetical protein
MSKSNSNSNVSVADHQAQQCDSVQERMQFKADMIKNALAVEEMQRFRQEKARALQDLMSHFACAEAQLTKRVSIFPFKIFCLIVVVSGLKPTI